MATLKKTILGRLSGTVGDIVFRNKNGRNFVSSKPASFNAPSDSAALERRARFRLTAKFSRAVVELPVLKELWYAYKPSHMTVNNFIIKENYPHITHEDISNSVLFVPGLGFGLNDPTVEITPELLRLNINAIGNNTGINPDTEVKLRMAGVVFLTSPVDTSSSPYAFISLSSGAVNIDLQDPLSFTVDLSNQNAALYNQYQAIKAFCTLLTFTAEDNIVHFAQTVIGAG